MVVFEEIPNEITLAINITNCPCKCKGCHSKFLWEDIGIPLTEETLGNLIKKNKGITCVCFMGGDGELLRLNSLVVFIKNNFHLKVGWYSGQDIISKNIKLELFDFIKIGHYDDNKGPLNKRTTNQRMYKIIKKDEKIVFDDITHLFWKKYNS